MKIVVLYRYWVSLVFCFYATALAAQWSPVLTGTPGDMHCVSLVGNHIFLGGDQIVKSPNGGGIWTAYTLFHTTGFELIATDLLDIHFFDDQNGVAVGFIVGAGEDIILRTTNGGQSWSYAYQGIGNGGFGTYILRDLHFINATTGWAVGRNGNIYKTTNAGVSWTVQNPGTSSELYSVWFVNPNLGFVAGDNVLLKTTNGGANWTPTPIGGAEKVVFTNANTGYAGSGNSISKTTDGGQNWTNLPLPQVSGYLTDLHLSDPQTCYALFSNTVLRSTDGGLTWEETAGTVTFTEAQQFKWLDAQQGVIAGGTLFCWITTNAGAPYKPMADFDVPQSLCSGTSQLFLNKTADLPNYTYQWFLNGTPVSTQRNLQITLPNPDTDYAIRLEVSNGVATDLVEYNIHTTPLTYLDAPEIVATTQQACQGDPVSLFATLNNAAFWTLTANGQATGIEGNLAQLNYTSFPQTTTVFQLHGELTGVCNTASSDQQVTVQVTALPLAAEVVAEKTLVCPGDSTRILILNSVPGVSYRLYASAFFANPDETQTGNGDTLFFKTPPIQDQLVYFLEVKNQNCQRNLGVQVVIAPEYVLALLYEDQITGAVGTVMQMNDTFNLIGSAFSWKFGPLALPTTATGKNPAFQFTQPGFYTIYVEAGGQAGCTARDSLQIEVFGQGNLPAGPFTTCDEHQTPLLASNVETREHILDAHRAADGTLYTIGYRTEYQAGLHHNLSIKKLDAAGNLLWSYFLPQATQPLDVVQRIGTTIAADEAGNMYLTGTYYGSEIVLGGEIIYSGPLIAEGFVVKLDPQGNLLWLIRAPGSGAPVGVTDLLYVNDEQIYLVAPETHVLEFPNGFKYSFPPDYLLGLIQIDADGNFVRAESIAQTTTSDYHVVLSNFNPNLSIFAGPATTRISPRMTLDKLGRLVIVGEYRSPMQVGDDLLTPKIPEQRNGFVAFADMNLNVVDAFSTYGVADIQYDMSAIYHQINAAPSFALDDAGNIFQSFTIDNIYNYPQPYHFAEVVDGVVESGDDPHFLLKYDASGNLQWHTRNGPLRTPWLATGPTGSVHALASYGAVLGLNDIDGTKRSVTSLGGSDIALLSWDANGQVLGATPLGSSTDDDIEWLFGDGCGGFTGLLAQNVGPYYNGDPLQYFSLMQFDESVVCTPDCPFAICVQPQEVAFCRGKNAYMHVGAVGEGLTYQWQRSPGIGVNIDLTDDAVYSGTKSPLLQIDAAAAPTLNTNFFRCLITDASGVTIESYQAAIVPLDTPVVMPLPGVVTIAQDQLVSIVAHTEGNGLQYEWQYLSSEGWTPAAFLNFYYYANTDSILIKGFEFGLQNGQQLRCRIFNAEGCFVYSSVTTLQFVSRAVDIMAEKRAFQILAWPNPFTEEINLEAYHSENSTLKWTVFDVNGREMINWSTDAYDQKTTLPTGNWPAGMYQIKAAQGERVAWKRVVKVN